MTATEVCWTISSVFIAVVLGVIAVLAVLLPARTDTRWWHRYILNRAEVR